MEKKIVTFGEIMLRLTPPHHERFVQASSFGVVYGGGEANVAVSLSNFEQDAIFVTKLPKHEIGQAALNSLRQLGVDTSKIVRGGERLGVYYYEKGASQRPSKVIYDRAESSIACASPEEFDWDDIFEGVDWFHFTGITPALNPTVEEICMQACKAAKEKGITVSCDLNYRKKLWSREEANAAMSRLCKYVDVCIANEEDAKDVFDIEAIGSDVEAGTIDQAGYRDVAQQLIDRFAFKVVAITLRTSISASENKWAAMLSNGKECYFSRSYDINIVDRVGGGDSFGAGLIYSFLKGKSLPDALEFAVAASCLKHSIDGDANIVAVDEVDSLVKGSGSGRVQR